MTPAGSKRVILGAAAIVAVSTIVRDVRRAQPPRPRVVVGAVVAAGALSIISGPAPRFAAALAVLSAVGALVTDSGNTVPTAIIARTTSRTTSRTG
jgi:hypothetical protein